MSFCLRYKLKAIEMFGFEDGKDCIETAKYFLKNAGVLEKLTMRTQSYIGENEILKIDQK